MTTIEVLAASTVMGLPPLEAVQAIEAALRAGLEPADTPARGIVGAGDGELLLMPATAPDGLGVKLVTVAPQNPGRGLPRIHGVYVLFDPVTLAPAAVLDGAALTTVRTPAVSLAAVRSRLPDRSPLDVVVFGAGPQGQGHLRTLAAVLANRPVATVGQVGGPLVRATVVVRDVDRATLEPTHGVESRIVRAGTPAVAAALARADLVVCATTAEKPLFGDDALRRDVVVIAVGAHDPSAAEVPPELAGRAVVVVEDPATALREAGVVRAAVTEGLLAPHEVLPLRDVVRGDIALPPDRALLFVSVGMAWEDLVVAQAVHGVHRSRSS